MSQGFTGGERNTTSALRVGAIWKKSPTMNSMRSATPYTPALCLASSIFVGSISIAITTRKKEKVIRIMYIKLG
jgi:hypothetical protein